MHKETVNTFTKGMVKDTHPLTTPADILTDCLNGTLITYNGNEMILQNDMGNTLIGTAALPEGYVPIGVTEYGGVVYVASYNPSTGKGLIGSFPSPLLAHMSEMWSVNISTLTPVALNLDLKNLFYASETDDIIRTEYKAYLGRDEHGKDLYMLHTGDKILIASPKITEGKNAGKTLMQVLAELACIQVQFAILKKDGSIEIVEGNYLDGEDHVYTGKSSGYPLVIIKLLTLRSFNLERKYSRGKKDNGKDTINITFTGKVEKEESTTNVSLKRKVGMADNFPESYTNHSEADPSPLSFIVEKLPMEGTLKYEVIPVLDPQGNLVSMKKEGTIDLSKFKSDSAELKNWSYIVFDTYMKINWSFDYYNLDDDKEIKRVDFIFKAINGGGTTSETISLEKDSFNGSFEEIINFEDAIYKNNIYIVEIVGFKGVSINDIDTSDPVHLGNRMVYTSGIFNQYYGTVKDFTNTGFRNELPSAMWAPDGHTAFKKSIEVKITPTIKVTKTTLGDNVTITNPLGNTTTGSVSTITSKNLTVRTEDRGTGQFLINVNNNYGFEVGLRALIQNDSQIVGSVAANTISTMLSSFSGSKLTFTDESQLIGNLTQTNNFTLELEEYSTTGTYEQGESFDLGKLVYNPDLQLSSLIKVKATDVKSKVIDKRGLRPLYYSDMPRAIKDKSFTAWNKDYPLFCMGADENDYHYNVTLAGGGNSGGTSTGAGCDDTGLNTAMELMGLPMVSMAAGMDGDEASYSPDESSADLSASLIGASYRRRTVAGWGCSDNEIDGGDNFLMAVWKLTDNQYRFSLLGSQKSYDKTRGRRLVRLDYMLRCLLSLIFTKQAYKDTVKYITTSSTDYAYYNPQVKVDVDLKYDGTTNYNDVSYGTGLTTNYDVLVGDFTIEHLLQEYFNRVELPNEVIRPDGLNENELMTVKYDFHQNISAAETTFATDFGIDDLSSLFSNSIYEESGNEGDDKSSENWIYTIDWTAVDTYGRDKVYEIQADNTFRWKIDDLTPFLKLSGTKDGSGFAFVGEDGSAKVKYYTIEPGVIREGSTSDINDPLSLAAGSPSAIDINVVPVGGYNTDKVNGYKRGGLMFESFNYGDILRTWDEKQWPFYHSFQHVFKTYCLWKAISLSSEVPFNEIVVNRDTDHVGALNVRCMWRHNKDENAPDMVGALGNSYNSIYARRLGLFIVENANYTE